MISIKKISIPILFFVFILLFAYQGNENDLMFVGEGENWFSEVTVKQTDGDENYQIQINYKGNSIQEIDNFNYYVEAKNKGVIDFGGNSASLNKEGIYQSDLLVSNSPSTSVKDELVIDIEWNGNSESFNLINK